MLATTSTTTITSDPGILCFHHCNVKVFCFTLPHTCPHCNAPLDADVDADGDADSSADADPNAELDRGGPRLLLLPFRLPYPFVRATQYPCAIVLRPSTGDFLKWVPSEMDRPFQKHICCSWRHSNPRTNQINVFISFELRFKQEIWNSLKKYSYMLYYISTRAFNLNENTYSMLSVLIWS